jgi:alkylation response protein AidB-like acyl-CoA dehydrogenase
MNNTINSEQHHKALNCVDAICDEVIAKLAPQVDKEGRFPSENIQALADMGLLGLLIDSEFGGMGLGLPTAVEVVKKIATHCPSTGMVVTMHFSACAILNKYGSDKVRRAIAKGEHLSTLALSEVGSRSHFWAPVSTAELDQHGDVLLNARKSFVTSASQVQSYVWSSLPLEGDGLSSLWFVPSDNEGVAVTGAFDGLGLRANDSAPVVGDNVRLTQDALLHEDGKGMDVLLQIVVPYFQLLSSAVSVGLMHGAQAKTIGHVSGVAYASGGGHLAELPTIRSFVAQMQNKLDMSDALLNEAVNALVAGREDTLRRILGVKSAVAENATTLLATGMRVCGGAAFRKEVGLDRYFRDAQAATVMSPTVDILYDMLGRHLFDMELM